MSSQPDSLDALLPLREPTFFILLSLAPGAQEAESKHGYAILKQVEALSRGKVRLSTGTLYEALARLLDQGLVERLDEPEVDGSGAHPGKPRKAYRLTRMGRRALDAERQRLQALLDAAHAVLANAPE